MVFKNFCRFFVCSSFLFYIRRLLIGSSITFFFKTFSTYFFICKGITRYSDAACDTPISERVVVFSNSFTSCNFILQRSVST